MRGLNDVELRLMIEIHSTGDFHGGDAIWDTFELLEDRGLLGWTYGPISRELDETYGPNVEGFGEESDPVVTAMGHTILAAIQMMSV